MLHDVVGREAETPSLTPERLDEAKEEFLAAAAGYLDTPVMAVLGIAQLLRDRSRDASAIVRNRLIEMLVLQAGEAASVVGNILTAYRLDTGDLELESEAVDVREVVETLTVEWEAERRSRLTITGEAVAVADLDGMGRVIGNILDHAGTAGAREISIRILRSASRVVAEIAHDGEVDLQDGFEILFDDHGVTRAADGTPTLTLGLSVARRLARAMGGDVTVHRDQDRVVFEVSVPSALGHDSAPRGRLVLDPGNTRPNRAAIGNLLEARSLEVAYQPILDLSQHRQGVKRVVGHESLARFPYSNPQEWFDAAGNAGMRLDLELAAIEAAVSGLSACETDGFLGVNLSDGTLTSSRLYDALGEVDPGRVVLELSEEAVVRSYEVTNRAVSALTERGYRLAIDDVGSGEIDLWHILRLDPAVLKIDIALVRDLEDNPRNAALVRALTAMARDLGMMVIAEGVESERERDRLCDLGVEYGQGYLLGKPEPLA
jgi:EAL domain-containing protein (putative c-di-GMP-specific phosphodiesterase class I)